MEVNSRPKKEYLSNTDDSVNPLSIYPTDICCFLRQFTHSEKADLLCICIASYVSCVTWQVSELIVWLQQEEGSEHPKYHVLHTFVVKNVPTLLTKLDESDNFDKEEEAT